MQRIRDEQKERKKTRRLWCPKARVSQYEWATVLNAAEKPNRTLSEKFNGFAKLETNLGRVVFM